MAKELCPLTSLSSTEVIYHFKKVFSTHGIPETLVTDNGAQFVSQEFSQFANCYGFKRVTCSPRYPQANGEVERMVKTVKELLLKSGDLHLALLAYRDTPGPLGKTPAKLLMGRRLRTTLPLHTKKLAPKTPNLKEAREKDAAFRETQRQNYDRRHAARHMFPLVPGDSVWVKDYRRKGVVLQRAKRPRSYIVVLESGGQIERNRRALIKQAPNRGSDSKDGEYEFLSSLDGTEEDGNSVSIEQTVPDGPEENGTEALPSDPLQPPPETSSPAAQGEHVTRFGRKLQAPRKQTTACAMHDGLRFAMNGEDTQIVPLANENDSSHGPADSHGT
ncbi:uncharacterized protein LOC144113757 [Amblyomma americanum]